MPQNRATVAWIFLLLSFFSCCLIAFATPMATNLYLAQALRVDTAQVEVIGGAAIVQKRGSTQETATTGSTSIGEGDVVRAAANSQVMLWLPGGSNVRLWPETKIGITKLQSSKYNHNNAVIQLHQESGHSRVEVAMLVTTARSFQIATPEGTVTLREGSYSLDLQSGRTEVTNHFGSASLEAAGRSVELLQRERAAVTAGNAPTDPVPSARNLVVNGDFGQGLEEWQSGNREAEEPVLGAVMPELADGLPAVRFLRAGATKHAETFLLQNINRDVTDFQSLKLGFDLKLVSQSLSGGGWLGSEYPLMVKVKYRDVGGSESTFRRGFYYQNSDRHPTTNGESVEQGVWIKRDGYDLFNRSTTDPRPVYIISIELAASGWSFESLATNVRLTAE